VDLPVDLAEAQVAFSDSMLSVAVANRRFYRALLEVLSSAEDFGDCVWSSVHVGSSC